MIDVFLPTDLYIGPYLHELLADLIFFFVNDYFFADESSSEMIFFLMSFRSFMTCSAAS